MSSILYRGGVIHSAADPFAEALLVDGSVIAWIGANDTADGLAARADRVIDLDGALVAPGFVDAHVHLLETGLALTGLDLSVEAGVRDLPGALAALRAAAQAVSGHGGSGHGEDLVQAYGWDELAWPERRPPTRQEIDDAVGGLAVYAARADGHSAVVSTAFATRCRLAELPGWDDSGWVTLDAHDAARTTARDLAPAARTAAYHAALRRVAELGIVSVHEQSAPHLDTRAGLREILALSADPTAGLPHVVGYRGELCTEPDDARALLAAIPGLAGIAGDINIDGSLGSRTAALRSPYLDAPGHHGTLYLTADYVADHLSAVAAAGTQGGFHIIGDRAMDEFVAGLTLAAERIGESALRAAHNRVEHALFVDAAALQALLVLGVRLSLQPAFEARWGGPDGLYAARLGPTRVEGMSPFADLLGAGVPLGFGSDSPITPLNPWAAVLAAMSHHDPDQRISARAAFRAHTRGGWRLAGIDGTGAGELRVGAPAHLAVWRASYLTVQSTARASNPWSTDARAGTPLLPELGAELPMPECRQTLRDGNVIFDTFD